MHVHDSGWKLTACRTGTSAGLGNSIPPLSYSYSASIATNWQASLQNTLDAAIETPYYPEGIGTIYFEAINVTDPTEITVEIATNMIDCIYIGGPTNIMLPEETPQYSNNWQVLDVLTLNAASVYDFTRYQRLLNYRQAARLRIRRSGELYTGYTSLDKAMTAVDNICISLPPSDVVIHRSNSDFNPGYPFTDTNITIHCYIDNIGTNSYEKTDHNSRTSVLVYYRWRYLDQVSNAWASLPMTYVDGTGDGLGNGERYEVGLPVQTKVGDLEYYFSCSFEGYRYRHLDYTKTGYPYVTEWLSPKILRGDISEPDGREFYARLRPFSSRFGAVYVVSDQFDEPIAMTLVKDDEWRGMVPVNNGDVTNLTWCFMGTNAYVSGQDTFDSNAVYWAEASQARVDYVPFGGRCVESSPDARMRVLVDRSGHVQIVFNTATLEYMASRAEYQNFNLWTAPDNSFTESSGQASKQRFASTFDSWPTNSGVVYTEYFIGNPSSTNVFQLDPFPTFNGWQAGSAAYVLDRGDANALNRPIGPTYYRNRALRLKGGEAGLGLGYIHNLYATRPDGIESIDFKCHLGQPVDNDEIAYYKSAFTRSNYAVTLTGQALTPISPENPSISVIGYYQGRDTFYEYRVTAIYQSTNPTSDRRLKHELYKWVNGSCYLLKTSSPNTDQVLTSGYVYQLRLYNTGALTTTDIRCSWGGSDTLSYADTTTDRGVDNIDNGLPLQSGTAGFLSAECSSVCSDVKLQNTTTGAALSGTVEPVLSTATSVYSSDILNWSLSAGRFVSTPAGKSPNGIYSVIPTQSIGVYLQSSDRDSTQEPAAAGSASWVKYAEIPVTGFGYQTYHSDIKQWRAQYLMLRVMGRSDSLNVDVSVDELRVASWRGQESSDSGDADDKDWVAYEAWVVTNSVALGHVVQLDHSRADPSEDQAIRSPELTNGMGMLEFDYKVLRGPAKLTVQYDASEDNLGWVDVRSFVVTNAMSDFVHALAYLGTNDWGYLRVLNDRNGGYSNALVEINNIVAWDEPLVEDTSWRVYNAKITDTDKQRIMLDETKACFLNNSQTLEADPAQTMYQPFLQSPLLPAGLGDVTFMARAYSNNQPATVTLFASTNGWNAPVDSWFDIHQFLITNMTYETYSFEPDTKVGGSYDAVRLVTGTYAGSRRACFEEVAVSEPVFPGFQIENVRVLCKENNGTYSETRFQPLDSDQVGVEAVMSNVQLSPSNIHMYVSYYVGTNVWGVNNWPAGEVITKPMSRISETSMVFRTSTSDDIPFQETDQVVQYYVWATFMGGVQLQTQQATFDIPSWYYPSDLNKTYASQGWSPYYLVYGVPAGAVWINEVNTYDSPTNGVRHYGENKYIEIAVPAGVDLAGWSVDLVKEHDDPGQMVTITIPSGLALPTAVTNDYAFFVIGQNRAFVDDPPPALPKVNYETTLLAEWMPYINPGGIRLRRPMGMYEHAIAYDAMPQWFSGADWAALDPEGQFVYVGPEYNGGSLSVTNSQACQLPTAQDWTFPLTWTPGYPNIGQNVPNFALAAPGVSNAVIMSSMNISYGTQGGQSVSPLAMKVAKGTNTNIEYRANNWYRLHSIKVNNVEALTSGDVSTYNLLLANIQTNINIYVSVVLRQDIANMSLDGNVLNWLMSFGDGALAPTYYYGRELSLTERYWLNANPMTTNYLEGSITKIEREPAATNFFVTARLALNGANCTELLGDSLNGDAVFKIAAKVNLNDPEWTMVGQYLLTPNSFDGNHTSRVFVENPFRFWLPEGDGKQLFFRWVIEYEDPLRSKTELINSNTPVSFQ